MKARLVHSASRPSPPAVSRHRAACAYIPHQRLQCTPASRAASAYHLEYPFSTHAAGTRRSSARSRVWRSSFRTCLRSWSQVCTAALTRWASQGFPLRSADNGRARQRYLSHTVHAHERCAAGGKGTMVMITSKRAEDGDGETAGVEESHKIQKCVACSSIIRNPCSNKQHGSNPCMPPCVVSYTGVAIKVSFSGSANSESCALIFRKSACRVY